MIVETIRADWIGQGQRLLPPGLELVADLAADLGLGVRLYRNRRRQASAVRVWAEDSGQLAMLRRKARTAVRHMVVRPGQEELGPPFLARRSGRAAGLLRQACQQAARQRWKQVSRLLVEAARTDRQAMVWTAFWLEEVYGRRLVGDAAIAAI